jgi:hypothetical protein
LLTIGLPVHNGEQFIAKAIESILGQDYEDFSLLVSDNASTDATATIVQEYSRLDQRIHYVPQKNNLGAIGNFLFVATDIRTPYFMWFASDDVMSPGFLQSCIGALESDSRYGMAFTGLCNIDSLGRPIREYPDIPAFSGAANWRTISRFLLSPEVFGKANLIYSVYRTPVLRQALAQRGFPASWGGDISFVLAALVQGGVKISPEVLFRKRWVRDGDAGEIPLPVDIEKRVLHQSCPLQHYPEYEQATIAAVTGSRFEFLTTFLMRFRFYRLLRMKNEEQEDSPEKSRWQEWEQWARDVARSVDDAARQLRGSAR